MSIGFDGGTIIGSPEGTTVTLGVKQGVYNRWTAKAMVYPVEEGALIIKEREVLSPFGILGWSSLGESSRFLPAGEQVSIDTDRGFIVVISS